MPLPITVYLDRAQPWRASSPGTTTRPPAPEREDGEDRGDGLHLRLYSSFVAGAPNKARTSRWILRSWLTRMWPPRSTMIARYCTVLRSRWYQSGIRRSPGIRVEQCRKLVD